MMLFAYKTTFTFLVIIAIFCFFQAVQAQQISPQININPSKHTEKLNKALNKAQQRKDKLQNSLGELKNFSLTDSLQNIKLFNKHRRDSLRWKNFYFGGDFGLSVGGKQIFVNISPLVGFKLSDKFSIGGGSVFQYLRTQVILIDPIQGVNLKQTAQTLIYGGRGFTRLFLHKKFFAQGDFELINVQLPTTDGSKIRNWVPGAWAGAGYSFDIGRGMGLNLILSYNFLYKEGKSPYTSPLDVRVGIQF
jgi:hypothetical protein